MGDAISYTVCSVSRESADREGIKGRVRTVVLRIRRKVVSGEGSLTEIRQEVMEVPELMWSPRGEPTKMDDFRELVNQKFDLGLSTL